MAAPMNELLVYAPLGVFLAFSAYYTRSVLWRLRMEVHRSKVLEDELQEAFRQLWQRQEGQTLREIAKTHDAFIGYTAGIRMPKSQAKQSTIPEHVDFDRDLAEIGMIEPFFHKTHGRSRLYWRKAESFTGPKAEVDYDDPRNGLPTEKVWG